MGVHIQRDGDTLLVSVSYSGTYNHAHPYHYRRIDGYWEMQGNDGAWFPSAPCCDTARAIQDYENCLRSYTYAESVVNLERQKKAQREIKNIFAPVKLKYNATTENRARFKREYSYARLKRRGYYENRLTN